MNTSIQREVIAACHNNIMILPIESHMVFDVLKTRNNEYSFLYSVKDPGFNFEYKWIKISDEVHYCLVKGLPENLFTFSSVQNCTLGLFSDKELDLEEFEIDDQFKDDVKLENIQNPTKSILIYIK